MARVKGFKKLNLVGPDSEAQAEQLGEHKLSHSKAKEIKIREMARRSARRIEAALLRKG
jgi:hypothetical protein